MLLVFDFAVQVFTLLWLCGCFTFLFLFSLESLLSYFVGGCNIWPGGGPAAQFFFWVGFLSVLICTLVFNLQGVYLLFVLFMTVLFLLCLFVCLSVGSIMGRGVQVLFNQPGPQFCHGKPLPGAGIGPRLPPRANLLDLSDFERVTCISRE